MIDNDLKWQSHIDFLYSRLLKFTAIFYKLQPSLTNCVLLLKKILRILQNQNKPLRTPVVQLYQSYNTLPIPKLHNFQLLCIIFKYLNHNKKFPIIFANFFTRNAEIHTHNTRSVNDLHLSCVNSLPRVRYVQFKVSFLWNNLPTQLKEIKDLSIFKKQLTNFLLFENASD